MGRSQRGPLRHLLTMEELGYAEHVRLLCFGEQTGYKEQCHDRLSEIAEIQLVKIDESHAGGSLPG